jgi:hypothetical protein
MAERKTKEGREKTREYQKIKTNERKYDKQKMWINLLQWKEANIKRP